MQVQPLEGHITRPCPSPPQDLSTGTIIQVLLCYITKHQFLTILPLSQHHVQVNLCLWLQMSCLRIHGALSSGWSRASNPHSTCSFHKPMGEIFGKEECHQSYSKKYLIWQPTQTSSSIVEISNTSRYGHPNMYRHR